jgi:arginase
VNITILGVPYSLDQRQIGMGAAPGALLDAGLEQQIMALGHAVQTEMIAIADPDEPRETRLGRLLTVLAGAVARARAAGRFPLILGGDCMVALGVLGGLGDAEHTGIIWLDAHGDFNTAETTISGYLGGMPLAAAVGRGLDELRNACRLAPIAEHHVVLVDARDLDPLEERALDGSAVVLVRNAGAGDTPELDRALRGVGSLAQLYLHVDIDILDPAEAPGVNYPAARGRSLAQLQAIVRQAIGLGNVAAMSVTAVNPEKDIDGRTVQAALAVSAAALTEL